MHEPLSRTRLGATYLEGYQEGAKARIPPTSDPGMGCHSPDLAVSRSVSWRLHILHPPMPSTVPDTKMHDGVSLALRRLTVKMLVFPCSVAWPSRSHSGRRIV